MKIREANKKDLPQLQKLFLESQKHEASFDPEVVINEKTPQRVKQLIDEIFRNPDRTLLVAENDGNIVGYILIIYSPGVTKSGWVGEIFITKDARRKGIGSKLMNTAINWLKQKGSRAIKLTAYKTNKTALTFYKKHEFKKEISKFINLTKPIT